MEIHNPSRIHFPETMRGRFILILATFVVALVFAGLLNKEFIQNIAKIPIYSIMCFFAYFPSGLLILLFRHDTWSPGIGFWTAPAGAFIWILYFGFSLCILLTNRRASRVWYIMLVILLIANVSGCVTGSYLYWTTKGQVNILLPVIVGLLVMPPILIGIGYKRWKRGLVSLLSILIFTIIIPILMVWILPIFDKGISGEEFGIALVALFVGLPCGFILGLVLPFFLFSFLDRKKQSNKKKVEPEVHQTEHEQQNGGKIG